MRARLLLCLTLLSASAAAQRPIHEPDDFVDPALHDRPIFLSRIVAGGVWNPTDRYRPIHGDAGFVLLTNSVYFGRWQFDYKHTEGFGEDPVSVQRCDCPDPVYFPTPPPGDATPSAPQPGRGDTLQAAFYRTSGDALRPITLRYRLSYQRRDLDTVVTSVTTGEIVERRSGHDQSFTLDADTHLRIRGFDLWGTLYFARTSRSGTTDDRAQNELAYVFRPPGFAAGEVLFRPKLTVGGLSGRGGTSLNLVNPYFEAFWRHRGTRVNFHLVWSPQVTRDGQGWKANHEIAVFADYTLWSKTFGR